MLHSIDVEHPAVATLLAASATGVVETLPVPENGCYEVEFGRVQVGGSVHDVLRVNATGSGAHTEILLIQPTTGVLSVATVTKAHEVSAAASFPESARVEPLESASRLARFEDGSEDDPVALIRRDVVPMGNATTIQGTMEILLALAERGDVGRTAWRAIREAADGVRDALAIEGHERRVAAMRADGGPEGPPRNRGIAALADGVRTASHEMLRPGHRLHMHEGHGGRGMRTGMDARSFLSRAEAAGMLSVDGGAPRPADEVILSYGDETSPYRQVTVDGRLMEGVPLFTDDVCVVQTNVNSITLRIADAV